MLISTRFRTRIESVRAEEDAHAQCEEAPQRRSTSSTWCSSHLFDRRTRPPLLLALWLLILICQISLAGCAGFMPSLDQWRVVPKLKDVSYELVEPRVINEIDMNMPDTEVVRLIRSAQLRKVQDAELLYRRALSLLTAPHEQQHRWSVLLLMGDLAWFQDRKNEGAVLMREAYDTAMRYHLPNSVAVITTGCRLAEFSLNLGRTDDALALTTQLEALLDRTPWGEPQAVADKIVVGTVLVGLREWPRGETLLKEALRARAFDQLPAIMRAQALSSLGHVSLHRNGIEQAIQYFDRASSEWGNHLELTAAAHRDKARLHMELGRLFLKTKKLYRAGIEFQHAEQTYELLQSPKDRARARSAMADILIRHHRYQRARDLLSPSYSVLKSPPDSYLAYTASLYARTLTELNDDAAAEQVLSETLALHERGLISLEDAAYFADQLSTVQILDGRICEAQATTHKSRALLAKARPDEEWTDEYLRPKLMFNGSVCTEPIVAQ